MNKNMACHLLRVMSGIILHQNVAGHVMPTPCYISIQGKSQGNLTAGAFTADSVGNIYVQGHEDEMLVQAFEHLVSVPTDPQSGQPAGQRVHRPFRFTVALNKAVPLLYNALASGEIAGGDPQIGFAPRWRGGKEHFFSTRLTDAAVVDIDCQITHCQDANKSEFTQLIRVALAYREIEWEHTVAGTSGADDWRAPLES